MNRMQLQGRWKQVRGKVRERWGRLTHDDLEVIGGRWDQLVGKIQERYGITREQAERQVDEFLASLDRRRLVGTWGALLVLLALVVVLALVLSRRRAAS